jgi:PPOX class probable F420-dependent enzyme
MPAADSLRRFVAAARSAVLATTDAAGDPRLVPICYVVGESGRGAASATGDERFTLYSPIDEKPKRSSDPLALARVRDITARPKTAVLVDRWSEEWHDLGWVRLACTASIVDPSREPDRHAGAIAGLRAKYPQYRAQRLESRPLIRLDCTVARAWGAIEEGT